jgi:hypothetical protein
MALSLATSARNAAADGVVDLLDAGSGPGTIQIRTGAKPATPNTAASGTLLGTLTFSDPAFGAASNGVATANAITSDNVADASGTAGYFRALDSNGAAVFDGTIGLTGSGADLIMNDVAIVAGGIIAISALTYTQPVS